MTQRSYFPRLKDLVDSDQFILFHDRQVIVRGDTYIWSRSDLEPLLGSDLDMLLIEGQPGSAVIAVNFHQDPSSVLGAENRSLRSLLINACNDPFITAGKASQILDWYNCHRFCGSCGTPTEQQPDQRLVSCPRCQQQYFPRINPCAIMLVTRDDEVLLARHTRFKGGFYSCLAGFIEVGETPEQTVVREVMEEVGLEVENVRYAKSQSWPFPSQLMLGFYADYKAGEIVLEPEEIEEAAWFKADQLPPVPSADISVAGALIRDHVNFLLSRHTE